MRLDMMNDERVYVCVLVRANTMSRVSSYHFHILLISFGKIQGKYAETTQKTDRI